jgi:cysteinyl-tRNA synthetase
VKPAGLSPDAALREWRGLHFVLAALGLRLPAAADEKVEIPAAIRDLAERRWAARAAKDWATSDTLRAELAGQGWEMKDGKEGYELSLRS